MMFVDYVKIKVIGGRGGDGCVSFRREKYIAKGGPNGGDGGRGGAVLFRVDSNLHTLQDLKYHKQYRAESGSHGSGGKKTGKGGSNIVIPVPPGTVFKRAGDKEIVAELLVEGDEFVSAKGGKRGRGNARFATPTRQSPDFAEPGKPGEEYIYEVELKLLADVGLVGFPNAGKSTLLSKLSSAKPKIADYPFTTLEPCVGIVKFGEFRSFVMADIPGLIQGASQGKGLGIQFLKHIERTKVLAILIECTEENMEKSCQILLDELKSFNPDMLRKPKIGVYTKNDLLKKDATNLPSTLLGIQGVSISSITGEGLPRLKEQLVRMLYG